MYVQPATGNNAVCVLMPKLWLNQWNLENRRGLLKHPDFLEVEGLDRFFLGGILVPLRHPPPPRPTPSQPFRLARSLRSSPLTARSLPCSLAPSLRAFRGPGAGLQQQRGPAPLSAAGAQPRHPAPGGGELLHGEPAEREANGMGWDGMFWGGVWKWVFWCSGGRMMDGMFSGGFGVVGVGCLCI